MLSKAYAKISPAGNPSISPNLPHVPALIGVISTPPSVNRPALTPLMAAPSPAPLSPIPRKTPATEFARWSKFHPACRLVPFNQDPALNDYMVKRGVRVAGVDYL